jgi:uncharacterized protein YjiS (DUF1127 family)
MFTSIVRRYQAWTRYETVRRELSHLTDSELADVGITRSDIERIASAEGAYRPSHARRSPSRELIAAATRQRPRPLSDRRLAPK